MAVQLKATQQKGGIFGEKTKFVIRPDYYNNLSEKKVLEEASIRSGISVGVIKACWNAAGQVIRAWATEGHSVAVPGLGTMRFGVNATGANKLEQVKVELIQRRKIIFTPNSEIKEAVNSTPISITLYDTEGRKINRVESSSGSTDGNPDETDAIL